MIVPKTAKLEKAASKDQTRPVLTRLYLRAGEEPGTGTLEATDSYMLVRVPVTLQDGDTEGFLPTVALTEARKAAGRHTNDVEISANGSVTYQTKDGATVSMDRDTDGKFPDSASLFPQDRSEFVFGVNPQLLAAAADALGSPTSIRVRFTANTDGTPNPLRPIHVEPMHGNGDAIIMPIKVG